MDFFFHNVNTHFQLHTSLLRRNLLRCPSAWLSIDPESRSLFLNNHHLSHKRKPLSIRSPKARPPYHSHRSSCFCSFPDPLPNVRIHLTLHIFRARKTSNQQGFPTDGDAPVCRRRVSECAVRERLPVQEVVNGKTRAKLCV